MKIGDSLDLFTIFEIFTPVYVTKDIFIGMFIFSLCFL
jgi:hypothetical protein